MAEKVKRLKAVMKNMGVIFKNMGEQGSKILQNMDESEKKINEQMSKIALDLCVY